MLSSAAKTDQPLLGYSAGAVAKPLEPLRKRMVRWTAWTLLALFVLLGSWVALFTLNPEYRTDPRSPRYLLWKHGWLPIDPATGYAAFGHDTDRDSVVMGLTPFELQKKFRRIRRPGDLLPDQKAYLNDFPPGTDIAWLGDTQFAVEFCNGRVVALHHLKG